MEIDNAQAGGRVSDEKEHSKSSRSLTDINCILKFAKLEQSDVRPSVQSLFFSESLDNASIKLLELDQHVLQALENGKRVSIRGSKNDCAVLVTDTLTYDLKEAETSNSLLLLPHLDYGADLPSEGQQTVIDRYVKSILHNYYELRPIKPRLKKLHQLLELNPYRGRECEGDELDTEHKFTLTELQDIVQASDTELEIGLRKLNAVQLEGVWRLLDFEFLSSVIYHIVQLSEERDWLSNGVKVTECCDVLTELFPREVIVHILQVFSQQPSQQNSDVLYISEDLLCRHFAELCLRNSGKFNLKEFLQAWQQSVPEGMKTSLTQIEGMALIDHSAIPEVIWYYNVDDLPEDVAERFEVLFEEKPRWTLEEITPYIRDLTNEKTDAGGLLTKFARASLQNGIKVFSSRKAG